jgi:hypothetical protein
MANLLLQCTMDIFCRLPDFSIEMPVCSAFKEGTLFLVFLYPEEPKPEFVNLLRSLGIDSQPGGPVRQPYLTYRPPKAGRIDFLGSIPGLLKWLHILLFAAVFNSLFQQSFQQLLIIRIYLRAFDCSTL